MKPRSPASQADSSPLSHQGSPNSNNELPACPALALPFHAVSHLLLTADQQPLSALLFKAGDWAREMHLPSILLLARESPH